MRGRAPQAEPVPVNPQPRHRETETAHPAQRSGTSRTRPRRSFMNDAGFCNGPLGVNPCMRILPSGSCFCPQSALWPLHHGVGLEIRPADLVTRSRRRRCSRINGLNRSRVPTTGPRIRRGDGAPRPKPRKPPLLCRGGAWPRFEARPVGEHAVQHDGELARERDLRLLRPGAPRDGERPILE